MIRTIGIVSSKGGVGKTTVTVNLAAALMEFYKNVIAVDADVKMCGLGLQLGMYYFPLTLNDILRNRASISEALYVHPSGLRIVPASLSAEDVNISKLKDVLANPFLDNHIILTDSPPGLERNAIAVLEACGEVITVTTPDIPAITDVMKTILEANKIKTQNLGIIVNRYKKGDSEQISIKEIESSCGLPVIGVIPEDKTISKSIFKRVPNVFLNPFSPSSIAFKKIAAELSGIKYNPPRITFLRRFLRRLKR